MSQNNTSSNETYWSFVAPARPSDTPGSGDSGGGGTTSWTSCMALSSSAHSGTSAGHGQTTPRGDHRDRLRQDQRDALRDLL